MILIIYKLFKSDVFDIYKINEKYFHSFSCITHLINNGRNISKIIFTFSIEKSWRVQDQNGLLLNKKNIKTKHEYIVNDKIIRANYTFGEFNNRVYKKLGDKKNKPKVLVLGDSFTFGWLLNDQETFIYQLADHYKNFEFINVAAGGWGTSDYLSYIENYCKTIKPDIILLFLNHTDHERAVNSNLYLLNDKMKLEKGKK